MIRRSFLLARRPQPWRADDEAQRGRPDALALSSGSTPVATTTPGRRGARRRAPHPGARHLSRLERRAEGRPDFRGGARRGEGVVLDGGGQRLLAFRRAGHDVRLIRLTVQNYDTMDPPDARAGAAGRGDRGLGRADWQLVDCTVQRIGGRGVSMSPGMHILRGRYVDNGHIGIGGRAAGRSSRAPRSPATTRATTAPTGRAAATRMSVAICRARCR